MPPGRIPVDIDSAALTNLAAVATAVALLGTEATLAALSAKLPASLGAKTGAASLSVVPASDGFAVVSAGNIAHDAVDGGAPVKFGGRASSTALAAVATGDRVDSWFDLTGKLQVGFGARVSVGIGVGATQMMSTVCSDGNFAILPVLTYEYNGTSMDPRRKPNASSRLLSSAATTNATSAKASAGDTRKVIGRNTSASVIYLKLYNKASAPTVGTDTPVLTIPLAPTSNFDINLEGHYFGTGIAYALTTGVADADTGAIGAAEIVGLNLTYA